MKKHTLICTVGTSLIMNFKNQNPELFALIEKGNLDKFVSELLQFSPSDRLCGAEINSVHNYIIKYQPDRYHICFLVSETDYGKKTGEILKKYFEKSKECRYQSAVFKVISHLNETEPVKFSREGLPHLVNEICSIIRAYGEDYIAINATGGFKAQIAIALMIGQAFGIEVYYKYELFNEIVSVPPMPITIDDSIVADSLDILNLLEEKTVLNSAEINIQDLSPQAQILIECLPDDSETLYSLSQTGHILLKRFHIKYPSPQELPADIPDEKRGTLREDTFHSPPDNEYLPFLRKFFRENKFVHSIYSISHGSQRKQNYCLFKKSPDEDNTIIGSYPGKEFSARFAICLDKDISRSKLYSVINYFTEKYHA